MDDDTQADATLTRRLADGDRTALADAFDRFAPTLTRYAWAQAERRQDARERLRWVRDEIAALAPVDRRICELCLLEGHSYAEAAEILGLSVGAVTQRVSRSRARLKKAVMHDEH